AYDESSQRSLGCAPMSKRVGTFFSPSAALVALGVVAAGLLLGAYAVYLVIDERRISIGGFLLAGLLVVRRGGGFKLAFPRGCSGCRARFEEIRTSYPAAFFDQLHHSLAHAHAGALAHLGTLPVPTAEERRATVVAELCPRCARVGIASAVVERRTG